MQSHLLSLNDFNMPKVFDAGNAAYTHIISLLLLDQGKYPSHPTMGVGLRTRWRLKSDSNLLENLQKDITDQVNRFLPDLSMLEVTVNLNNHILGIIINTATGVYAVAYDTEKDFMDTAAEYVLSDL